MFYKETAFQETAIGKIPKEWGVVRLGKSAKIRGNKRINNIDRIAFIPMELVPDSQVFAKYQIRGKEDVKSYTYCKAGDLLLAKITPSLENGKQGIVPSDIPNGVALATTEVFPIECNEVDTLFLFYVLKFPKFRNRIIASMIGTTGRQRASKESVKRLEIPLPELDEQQKIAEVLFCVDLAVQKTCEVIAKTERLKKGLMQQLLTKGIGHKKFKETRMGKMPEEWELVPFEKIIDQLKRGPSQRTNNEGIGYVYLTSGYLTDDGFIEFENLQYLEESKIDDINKYLLEPNDLLINCVNSYEKVGKVAVFEGYEKKVMVGFNNYAATLKTKANPFFIKYVLLQDKYKALLQGISKAAVQQVSFSSKDLFRVKVPLPRELEEQQCIVNILSTVDKKIELEKKERKNLERIKQGLMDLLLSGKVRVRVD